MPVKYIQLEALLFDAEMLLIFLLAFEHKPPAPSLLSSKNWPIQIFTFDS